MLAEASELPCSLTSHIPDRQDTVLSPLRRRSIFWKMPNIQRPKLRCSGYYANGYATNPRSVLLDEVTRTKKLRQSGWGSKPSRPPTQTRTGNLHIRRASSSGRSMANYVAGKSHNLNITGTNDFKDLTETIIDDGALSQLPGLVPSPVGCTLIAAKASAVIRHK